MILTLIFIVMIILGFIFIKINNTTYLDIDVAGYIIVVFGSLFLIISAIIIIASHACADNIIQKNKINYEGLCKRYEIVKSEFEDVSKSDVIGDITAWNMNVYNTKYWSENPWTNWFNPKKIADNLEYIPLEEEIEDTDNKKLPEESERVLISATGK